VSGVRGTFIVEGDYGAMTSILAKQEDWVAGNVAMSHAWPLASVVFNRLPTGTSQFLKFEVQRMPQV
jgi:hypothetical protein